MAEAKPSIPGSVLAGFGKAALAAGDVGSEEEMQTLEVLSSIPQGRTLRDDAKALGWKVNHKFKGMLILADKASKPVTLGWPDDNGSGTDEAGIAGAAEGARQMAERPEKEKEEIVRGGAGGFRR